MVIRARAIEVRYQRGGELAVSGVNLDLRAGTGLLITGDRGSGKSSVLRAVLGLAVTLICAAAAFSLKVCGESTPSAEQAVMAAISRTAAMRLR